MVSYTSFGVGCIRELEYKLKTVDILRVVKVSVICSRFILCPFFDFGEGGKLHGNREQLLL